MKPINQLNTDNLTDLWTSYGADLRPFTDGLLKFSNHWPNKVWVDGMVNAIDLSTVKAQLIKLMQENPARVFVSWSPTTEEIVNSEQNGLPGLAYSHSLIGMSLDLKHPLDELKIVPIAGFNCHTVTTQDIAFWCDLCSEGFGYKVDRHAMLSAIQHLRNKLYWFSVNDRPVGTALTAMNRSVVGLHQISVLPSCRGQGIATEIVRYLTVKAKLTGVQLAVLQASPMGLGVYKKLGFIENFELKNYNLKT